MGSKINAKEPIQVKREREKLILSDGEVDTVFEIEATITLESGTYLILLQSHKDGRKEDEGLVFKVYLNDMGVETYIFIKDDDIINEVFNEYYRLLDAEEQ